jgi:hypothetical protein
LFFVAFIFTAASSHVTISFRVLRG